MIKTAKLIGFRENLSTNHAFSGFDVRLSHFNHYLAMFFFYPKIWMNTFKEHVKTFSSYICFIYITTVKVFSVFRNNFNPIMYANKVFKPFHNGFIDRSKFNNGSMDNRKYSCLSLYGIDVKTSIPVNVTSKISEIKFFHVNSFTILYTYRLIKSTLNDLASGMRKHMRKSELYGDIEREIRRGFPAILNNIYIGHKSNRMPILNSAAARLGQAMRETQDVLQRDNLESSASIVNCVGGGNGDLPTEMAISDVDDIVALLQGNDGEYITNMVEAQDKFGTSPVGDSYGCMLTTRMIPVLNNMQGFIRKFAYPNIDSTLSSEWGGLNNVRFFVSSQGSVSASASLSGNDIANCFVVAKEAYKVVKVLDHYKSLLIDLETYEYAIAA